MTNDTFLKKPQRLNFSGIKGIIRSIFAIGFVIAGLSVSTALAKNVTIQWDTNDDADYYVVYWGSSSGDYSQQSDNLDVPATEYTAVDVSDSGTWYFAVKAFNSCGNSSDFSDEVVSSPSSELLSSISSPSSELSIMAGNSVDFQGSASGGNGSFTYLWDFGGSGADSSSLEDPGTIVFSNAGTFTITFTVTDDDGDAVTDTVKVNVASDTIPSATISSPSSEQSILAGTAVNFQGSASGGNGGLSFSWDFDGGYSSSSVEDPGGVIFSSPGTYEIAFTVTDSDGDAVTDTVIINVASDAIPSASIASPASEQSIMAGAAVNFQGIATGGNGSLSYVWDFDGGADSIFAEDAGSVTFANAGTYEVAFTVSDSDGDAASDTIIITVASDVIPTASILSPSAEQSIMANAGVNFQGSASGGNGTLTFTWDFEGGSSERSVEDPGNVIFTTAGSYLVTFSVTDSDGDVASDSVLITVLESTTPDTPVIVPGQPAPVYPDEETDVSLTPELQVDISEQSGQSRWQISQLPEFSSILIDITKKSEISFFKVPRLVLNGSTKYYWRVKLSDTKGESTSWSDTVSFSTTDDIEADSDSNGIPDNQEIDDTFDLDFDGTADIEQDNIKCVRSVVDSSHVMGIKKGRKVSAIEFVESIDHKDITDTSGMPDEMPSGLIGFNFKVDNPGDTAEITVCFSEPAPDNAGWYKYDSINGWQNYTSQVSFSSDRMSVSITLTDGGTGDADGTENGVIVDPGGLGIMDVQSPVVFSQSSEEGGCFIGSSGSLNGLFTGNLFIRLVSGICLCLGLIVFGRKYPVKF